MVYPKVLSWDPFEFLVYMCPVYDIAHKHGISIHHYADDTQLYIAFGMKKQEAAMAKMEACVNVMKDMDAPEQMK